jgi:glutamine amidotransferase
MDSTKKCITILDLGINNINSVKLALQRVAVKTQINIQNSDSKIGNTGLVVLPGLGSFGAGMKQLRSRNLDRYLCKVVEEKIPLVGICLGMQLLGESSEESPNIDGLGFLEGKCVRLPNVFGERVPNVGWMGGESKSEGYLFPSLTAGKDFYFVHSYHFVPNSEKEIIFVSEYGNKQIVTGVKKSEIIGFQFHPEKSSQIGISLIKEIIDWGLSEV